MALRIPDFTVPQPRPSPIEQAFVLGLENLVQLPFQKAAENRVNIRQIAGEKRRAASDLETFTVENAITDRTRSLASLRENYVPRTQALDEQLRQAGFVPEDIITSFEGQDYLPKNVLVSASQENAPLSPDSQDMVTTLQSRLAARGFAVPKNIHTRGQLSQALNIIQPEISVASLEAQDADRDAARRLAAQQRSETASNRIYTLLANTNLEKTSGLGVHVLGPDGRPTEEVVPLAFDERVAYDNPYLDYIAQEEQRAMGSTTAITKHFLDLRGGLQQRGVVPIRAFSDKQLDDEMGRVTGAVTSPEMQMLAQLAMQFQLPELTNQIDTAHRHKVITNVAEAASFLQSNPLALRGLLAALKFPHGMTDVENARQVPGSANFNPIELRYMSHIFGYMGKGTTLTTPPSFVPGTSPGVGPAPGSLFNRPPAEGGIVPPPSLGPTQHFSPLNTAPPTSLFDSEADSTDYANFANIIGTRLAQDSTLYSKMVDSTNAHLTSPDSAAKYLRGMGMAESRLQDLFTGTQPQRNLALQKHRRRIQWALQDAYNSAYAPKP